MGKYKTIQLDGDIVERLFAVYRKYGHPYGKNSRKRKKWITRYAQYLLRQLIQERLDKSK
jgi:hypothetical protein